MSALPESYRFGHIEVRPTTRQLVIDGVAAAVGSRAFDLLLALMERRERLVSKHELLDAVWPGLVVEENNLQVQVSTLRRLLGPTTIATIPGRGYRFAAALEGADGAGAADVQQADRAANAPTPGDLAEVRPPPTAAAVATVATPAVPGTPASPGNLAAHSEPLIGRDDDLRRLLALIEAHPVVTIVGTSGMGKTSLALAAARALRGRWRDGAWFVEGASVSEAALLVPAVAQALRITLPASGSAQDHLVGVLGSMALVLVLDNCEHLVDAAGALAEAIAARAPDVRVLVTSQELLNVPGETLFKLNPLAVPPARSAVPSLSSFPSVPVATEAPFVPAETEASVAVAAQFGAVHLFAERARSADPQFALSAANVEAVGEICRRLDGLPLAIELAAARVRLLGVSGLRDKLGERFRILTGGARTAMRRHQTLHAALDWSHALLSGAEQVVLRRLGAFAGGCSLELAQQVAQDGQLDEWAVLDAMGGLVDKSLLVADASEPPRYRLLETTRAYALEKLAEAGETEAWIERHARAVGELFERTEEARAGEQGTLSNVQFMRRLAPELDNARAALDWASGAAGDLNLAVGLAGAAALVCINLALSAEALGRLMSLRARIDDSVDPPRAALFWDNLVELGQTGHLPLATALDASDRAERFYRACAAPRRLFQALHMRAWLLAAAGEWRSAQELLPEMRALESPAWPASLRSRRLGVEGWIHRAQGRFEQALAIHTDQRALAQGAPDERRNLIASESLLCQTLGQMGRYDDCIALARSVIAREGGEPSASMPIVFASLMAAQVFSGRIDDARQTLLQAMPRWRRNGTVLWTSAVVAVLLAELGGWADAARVGAASEAFERRAGLYGQPGRDIVRARLRELLTAAPVKPAELELWRREGATLDDAGVAAICLRVEEDAGSNVGAGSADAWAKPT